MTESNPALNKNGGFKNAACLGGNSMTEILKPEIFFGPFFLGYVGVPLLKHHHHLGDSQTEVFTVHELNSKPLPGLS